MGVPLQQRARQRKIVYIALIVALFTGSLLYRKFVVETQANDLQLRDTARGEVALTSSFVRLSLTGSRAIATTILWNTALDRMKRHEWNELELLVNSISTLQPYFVTPWVFQSWNLAFNVAVECDRPRDKYYYISRGLELLAEGERRNQGTAEYAAAHPGTPVFPGNPEMRHYMGFYFQLKVGASDEKTTMRCLLDMSMMDPLKRDPKRFLKPGTRGEEVDLEELRKLCQEQPRLIRRLREGLNYDSPKQIVAFLDLNKDVPNRFKPVADPTKQKESELEIPRKQFPILPPVKPRDASAETGPAWPNPLERQLSKESSVDVFLICRTWYQYAQEPLPPALKDEGVTVEQEKHRQKLDRLRREEHINFRDSKTMATPIFRSYPSRAEAFMAEALQQEGWFDEEGWLIRGWFEPLDPNQPDLQVGSETKYHAGPVWRRAYEMYKQYGVSTGLYLTPAETAELNKKAEPIRVIMKIDPSFYPSPLPLAWRNKAIDSAYAVPGGPKTYGESYDAQQKLARNGQNRSMTNYDGHLYQSEGEMDPQTLLARKLLYQAGRHLKKYNQEALPLYEDAWPLLVDVGLRLPKFFPMNFVQDDVYESMLKYLQLSQKQNPRLFRNLLLGMAQMSVWPHPDWKEWKWIDSAQWEKITPAVRITQGPLETVAMYSGPEIEKVREDWTALTEGAKLMGQVGFAPPVALPSYALAGSIWERRAEPPVMWRYLIDVTTANGLRERFGLLKRPDVPAIMTPPPSEMPKLQK
jgi:hypothetical protein